MDYNQQLNTIISRLNDVIEALSAGYDLNNLLFLVLSIFLVIYVMRGE